MKSLNRTIGIWSLSIFVSVVILIAGGMYYTAKGNVQQTTQKTTITTSSYFVQPDDFKALAQTSSMIVEGIVKDIKPAVWTTPNGLPPMDISSIITDPGIQLRTPVLISIERTIKGDILNAEKTDSAGELLFTMLGGETEQYIVKAEDNFPLVIGDRVIVFLNKAPENAEAWANISPYYPEFYFIESGDKLIGPQKTIEKFVLETQLEIFQETK